MARMTPIARSVIRAICGYFLGNWDASNLGMPVQIVRNEVSQGLQQSVATGIFSAIGNRAGLWEVDITSDLKANAWDVEVFGPNDFHWARRFSGEDRDAGVISEAIRSALIEQAA